MRTRYLPTAGLVSLVLASGLGAGCDDVTAGQIAEDPAAPKLLRIVVQDERPRGGRTIGTDLLDTAPAVACDDSTPCVPALLGYPNPSCVIPDGMTAGLCPDQLSGDCGTPNTGGYYDQLTYGATYDSCGAATSGPRPVYIGTPIAGGGNSIRLVFSKALNPSVEAVMVDPMTGAYTYALAAGVVELDGPDGMPVELLSNSPGSGGGAYYDAGGSSSGSDPINIPLGPAIVIKPAAPLAPNSVYTIKVDATKIVDHANQPATGVTSPYSFTTEQLALLGAAPDVTSADTVVLPDDVIQLTLNADVDSATLIPANFTLMCGAMMIKTEVWKDQGADPTACSDTPGLIDVKSVSSLGNPVDLPEGMCTLTVAGVKDAGFGKSTFAATFTFAVKGPIDPTDAASVTAFVLPEQCVVATVDMAMASTADMSMPSDDASPADGGSN